MTIEHLLPLSTGRSTAGHLSIAGHDVVELANQFGTPLYLYDSGTILNQVKQIREQLERHYPGRSEVTYAAKAYFSLGLARYLVEWGLGVDVVSLGEMGVARRAGFTSARVHLHGNNKSYDELSTAIRWGVQAVVIDSLEELEYLDGLAGEVLGQPGQKVRVWLRISPGLTVDTHVSMQTAHHSTKFGLPVVDGQASEAICRTRSSRNLKLTGLHTHLGSNFFDANPYEQAIASLMNLAEQNGFIPEELSPGGGWGVPYLPEQADNPPDLWIQTICAAVQQECYKRKWPLPKLIVEPGRWLVARAGVVLYRVGTTKISGDGSRFIAVDGGLADNPRPEMYGAHYTALLANRPDEPPQQKVCVAGKYCESGDVVIPEVALPNVVRGDLLAVPVSGAYQLSMASNYNLAGRPTVLWLAPGQVEVLQKRERPDESGWWVDP